ncbi:MAG TPA: amino acid permease [Steroidobacteraceae bacterium]|nr:amino acid permease [Steroidobacteraceae bacterium]
MRPATTHSLRRILGLGFGLALVFGTMMGVGILRLPGTVAAALGSPALIMSAWVIGGVFSLMGAVAVAELAAMIPESGGFRVYARRAFGEGIGFAVGWVDWLAYVATLAYSAVTVVAFLGVLWPPALVYSRAAAISLLAGFTGIHWMGLRVGSSVTAVVSAAIGALLLVLVAGCFVTAPAAASTVPPPAAMPFSTLGTGAALFALVTALRAILTAYDGWYAPIYMAEENTNAARTLPRAIIGGTLLVVAFYLVINLAFLRVLPMSVLAGSSLPAADAARLVLPGGGAAFVTVLSLFTVLSLMNNTMLVGPRILFAIGRDGFLSDKTALVSAGGTPLVALAATTAMSLIVILTGTFEQIIALFSVLFLLYYLSAFLAVFVLRRTEPALPRPYKAFGYPFSTAVVLLGTTALLVAAICEDPRSGAIAAAFLSCCAPAYLWLARGRQMRALRASANC